MLRVLLVEDEPLFREGVLSSINWESLRMEVPHQAFDGIHALSLMELNSYEYVITDLFMPRMGGLEFLRKATEKYPQTNYIVLSGFSDFELVKEAFQLGVVDYILKSEISQQRINDVVMRQNCIRSRIISQASSLPFGDINTFYIKQSIFRNSGSALDTLGEMAISGLHIPVHKRDGYIYCCAVCLHLKELKFENETYQENRQKACALIDSIIMEEPSLYGYDRRGFYYLLYTSKDELNWFQLDNYWRGMHKILKARLPKDIDAVSMGFSTESAGLVNLEKIIKESTNILDFRLLVSECKVISKPKIQVFQKENSSVNLSVEKLATIFASLNKKNLCSSLRDSYLKNDVVKCCSPKGVSAYYATIYSLFLSFQDSMKLVENECFMQTMEVYSTIKLLDRSYSDYNAWLKKMAEVVEASICSHDKLTEQAERIIKEQYNDADLSLKSIANHLKTNPSYLSRIFSADIGKGLSLVLLEYRIEKAVELITQGDFKLYEIASLVGYENYETFSRSFKRCKGKSPQNYLKSLLM